MVKFSCGMATLAKLLLCVVGVCFVFSARTNAQKRNSKSFKVYWNVPSYLCEKYNIQFEPALQRYGIIANKGAQFRGDEIVILYDPGMFPAMLQDTNSNTLRERNGGIPQLGDIEAHLAEFRVAVEKAVPKNLHGVGVIDFEAWRPNFRQNWNDQVIYRNMSKDLERQRHPQFNEKQINEEAKANFEAAAKVFMLQTLKMAKLLRPNASWGYYGFPYCYNSGKPGSRECGDMAKRENNEIQWLFDESTAFHPSVYSTSKLTDEEHRYYVAGRMNEAQRMARRVSSSNPPPTLPYITYRFTDTFKFLSETRMYDALKIMSEYENGEGALIWGSSNDVKSSKNCQDLLNYVMEVLGPAVQRVKNGGRQSVSFGGEVAERPHGGRRRGQGKHD